VGRERRQRQCPRAHARQPAAVREVLDPPVVPTVIPAHGGKGNHCKLWDRQ
jgi:hypothetical protein